MPRPAPHPCPPRQTLLACLNISHAAAVAHCTLQASLALPFFLPLPCWQLRTSPHLSALVAYSPSWSYKRWTVKRETGRRQGCGQSASVVTVHCLQRHHSDRLNHVPRAGNLQRCGGSASQRRTSVPARNTHPRSPCRCRQRKQPAMSPMPPCCCPRQSCPPPRVTPTRSAPTPPPTHPSPRHKRQAEWKHWRSP